MQYLHDLLSANREQKEKIEKERRMWEAKSLPFQRDYAFAFAFCPCCSGGYCSVSPVARPLMMVT